MLWHQGMVSQATALLTSAAGDFSEGGSLSESSSGAREVLSSQIQFVQSRLWLPRRRQRWLGEERCVVEGSDVPEARGVPGTGQVAVLRVCWVSQAGSRGGCGGTRGGREQSGGVWGRRGRWWRCHVPVPSTPGRRRREGRAGGCCCLPQGRRSGGAGTLVFSWRGVRGTRWQRWGLHVAAGGAGALGDRMGREQDAVSLQSRSLAGEHQESPGRCSEEGNLAAPGLQMVCQRAEPSATGHSRATAGTGTGTDTSPPRAERS